MALRPVIGACAEHEVEAVRSIFLETYHQEYPYRNFFDSAWLKQSVHSDAVLMLVARHPETNQVVGTASIVMNVGANSDLMGEFGRLAVHPDARGLGVGAALMAARLVHAESRLHVALVEARTAHPISQRIALSNGFVPVGFLYQKHLLRLPESVVLGVRHFGPALQLRKNHPRILPEVKSLACYALEGCGLRDDTVVDEQYPAYPGEGSYELQVLTRDDMVPLLRIQRGRTRQREVFGATSLQQGFFKISQAEAEYILAKSQTTGEVAGAIGFLKEAVERSMKVVELVFTDERAAPCLLREIRERAQGWGLRYIEIDVAAEALALQKTLLELGFVPGAYVPAMVFRDVERLDVVRWTWVEPVAEETPPRLEALALPLYETVRTWFERGALLPQMEALLGGDSILEGASEKQLRRVLAAGRFVEFGDDTWVFQQGDAASQLCLLLLGEVKILRSGSEVASLRPGDFLGEGALSSSAPSSVGARAVGATRLLCWSAQELEALTRIRPDIGLIIYRNLARHLGAKLRHATQKVAALGAATPVSTPEVES